MVVKPSGASEKLKHSANLAIHPFYNQSEGHEARFGFDLSSTKGWEVDVDKWERAA